MRLTIVSAVNLLTLLVAAIFLLRGAKRAWRFIELSRRQSVRSAYRQHHFGAQRQAFRCATDLHYYVSRLALFFCAGMIGVTGLLLVALERLFLDAPAASWAQSVTILGLVGLILLTVLRTVRLCRRVLVLRRRLRRLHYGGAPYGSAAGQGLQPPPLTALR